MAEVPPPSIRDKLRGRAGLIQRGAPPGAGMARSTPLFRGGAAPCPRVHGRRARPPFDMRSRGLMAAPASDVTGRDGVLH